MATLNDKIIIFDDSCPMCRLYTKAFVDLGMLKPENRIGFAQLEPRIFSQLDIDRARHEIPLFDDGTRKTVYGLDALCLILTSRWRWLSPILNSRFAKAMLFPLYQIITFNRRVIAGCGPKPGFDCAPDFHLLYRVSYFLVALLVVGVLFTTVGLTSRVGLIGVETFAAIAIFLGIVGATQLTGVERWDYIGNLVTVTLEFSFLIVTLSVASVFGESSSWSTAVLGIAFAIVGFEVHRRLAQRLRLPG